MLTNDQLMGVGQYMSNRIEDGESFTPMEIYTMKSLSKELRKRIETTNAGKEKEKENDHT